MTVNELMPYMSPIDRRYWSSWLYQQDPAKFSGYGPGKIADYGAEGSLAQRGAFVAAPRASEAWQSLTNRLMNKADTNPANDLKMEDLGPAVPWLQRVFATAQQYAPPGTDVGTGGYRRSRRQERAMQNELAQLWSEAQGSQELQPYLELAKRFMAPSFENAPISAPSPMGFREPQYSGNYQSWSRNNFISNPRYL